MVAVAAVQSRSLSLHEHYSMELMAKYGVAVPRGQVALTAAEAKSAADHFGKCVY